MKKTVWVFGLISGAIMAVMMLATLPFLDRIGFDRGALVGYTSMVLAFLLVFFGIRSYRDNVGGGTVSFGRAFSVGILITLVSCVCYVITWEFIYYLFMPDFTDKYAAHAVEKLRANGGSAAAIQAQVDSMKRLKELYANPLMNAAITFTEPFPIGFVVTLVCAGLLRRRPNSPEQESAAATALSPS